LPDEKVQTIRKNNIRVFFLSSLSKTKGNLKKNLLGVRDLFSCSLFVPFAFIQHSIDQRDQLTLRLGDRDEWKANIGVEPIASQFISRHTQRFVSSFLI
jgi:hypothetical protein